MRAYNIVVTIVDIFRTGRRRDDVYWYRRGAWNVLRKRFAAEGVSCNIHTRVSSRFPAVGARKHTAVMCVTPKLLRSERIGIDMATMRCETLHRRTNRRSNYDQCVRGALNIVLIVCHHWRKSGNGRFIIITEIQWFCDRTNLEKRTIEKFVGDLIFFLMWRLTGNFSPIYLIVSHYEESNDNVNSNQLYRLCQVWTKTWNRRSAFRWRPTVKETSPGEQKKPRCLDDCAENALIRKKKRRSFRCSEDSHFTCKNVVKLKKIYF